MTFSLNSFSAILLIVLIAVIALLINYPGRLYYLQYKSQELIAISNTFPTNYFVGTPTDPPYLYMALGDSTVVGTGADTLHETPSYQIAQAQAKKGYYVNVINRGINGAKYSDVNQKELADITSLKPDLITVVTGANDVTHHTESDEYKKEVQELVTKLASIPKATILLANTPDVSMPPGLPYPYTVWAGNHSKKQNEILASVTLPTNAQIIDLYSSGRLDPKDHPHFYASDNFHPSAKGYAVWANLFIAKL